MCVDGWSLSCLHSQPRRLLRSRPNTRISSPQRAVYSSRSVRYVRKWWPSLQLWRQRLSQATVLLGQVQCQQREDWPPPPAVTPALLARMVRGPAVPPHPPAKHTHEMSPWRQLRPQHLSRCHHPLCHHVTARPYSSNSIVHSGARMYPVHLSPRAHNQPSPTMRGLKNWVMYTFTVIRIYFIWRDKVAVVGVLFAHGDPGFAQCRGYSLQLRLDL